MARQRGNLGGAIASSGTLLDTLQVRIETVFDGRGIAQALSGIASLRAAITGTGGASLGDAMTAALVAPVVLATARISSMRREMALLTSEVRAAAMITAAGGPGTAMIAGGLAGGAVGPWLGPNGVRGGVIGPVIGANRQVDRNGRILVGRANNGRFIPRFGVDESDDLAAAARPGGGFGPPIFVPPIGGGASADDDDDRPRRRNGRGAGRGGPFTMMRRRFGQAFNANIGGAGERLGIGANRAGAAIRGAGGTRIAQALGLAGLGSIFANLITVAGALAQLIGATLAGAFAALMTPVGLLIAGITALIALFVAANWDTFKEWAEWLGERGKVLLGEGWDDVVTGWNNVKNAFQGLWDLIKAGMSDDSGSLLTVLKFFGEAGLRILNSVGEAFGALLSIVADIVRALTALLAGDLTGVFENLGDAIGHALNGILEIFLSWFPELRGPWDEFWTWVENRAKTASESIKGFFEGLWGQGTGPGGNGPLADSRAPSGVLSRGTLPKGFSGVSGFRKGANGETSGIVDGDEVMDEETLARLERGNQLASDFGNAITSAFAQAVRGGGSLKDILRSLVVQLIDMVFQMAVLEPMARQLSEWFSGIFKGGGSKGDSKGGAGSNLFSSIISAVSSLFSGGFAKGGFIPPGKWGITGENGPEPIFGGRMGVTVHPNGGGAGAGIVYAPVYNFTGTSEEIAKINRMVANDRAQFTAKVGAVVGNMNGRGRGWSG